MTVHWEDAVVHFDVAARSTGMEGFLDDGSRVGEASHHSSHVDHVESGVEGPFILGVIDLEMTIGRDAVRWIRRAIKFERA